MLFHNCGYAASSLLKGKKLPGISIHGDMPYMSGFFGFVFIANYWFCCREEESPGQAPGLHQVVSGTFQMNVFLEEVSLKHEEELEKAVLNSS